MGYLAAFFVSAAVVLVHSYVGADHTILRQQLKWVTRGTVLAIAPFTLFYAIPFLLGYVPTEAMKLSVLSLGLLPLTFGYAIFRYRLMDVDLIFKRGMAYTLAAGGDCRRVFRDCGADRLRGAGAVAQPGPGWPGPVDCGDCAVIRSGAGDGFRSGSTTFSIALATTTATP